MYGVVLRPLGDSRMEVQLQDGSTRICRIRGALRRKKVCFIGKGTCVRIEEGEIMGLADPAVHKLCIREEDDIFIRDV